MEKVFIEESEVFGIATVTRNSNEASPETSKIMGCWESFLSKHGAACQNNKVYGVYTDYLGDENADYRFIAASDAEILAGENLVSIKIPAGGYHKFSFQGPVPEVIIEGWQHVWKFYSDEDYIRNFQTDFELYTSEGVDIYIGVE